jgi:hypothetical protein
MPAVDIHQISVSYVDDADRLLMRVRTRDDALFELWLTRRMMQRLWPRLRDAAGALSVRAALPHRPTLTPEAERMLVADAHERKLDGADFTTPFATAGRQRPLGAEPLLPVEVRLQAEPTRLVITARERGGRNVSLQLTEALAVALQSLLEQALQLADWGLASRSGPATDDDLAASRVLN